MDSSPSVSKRFNLIMIEVKVNCFLNVALIKNAPDLPQGWALNFCGVPSSRYAFISHVKPL